MQGNRLILKQWSLDWREPSNPFLSPAKVGTFVFLNDGLNKTILWRNDVKYLQYGSRLFTGPVLRGDPGFMVSPCARFSNFWASSFMDNLVSVSISSFEISLSILQPHRALSTGSPAWQRQQVAQTKRWIFKIPFFISFIFLTTNFLVSSKPDYLKQSALSFLVQKRKQILTISQKNKAISLLFCRTAQMKSEAQGKKQRFSRYKQSLRSSLLAFWGGQKEQNFIWAVPSKFWWKASKKLVDL